MKKLNAAYVSFDKQSKRNLQDPLTSHQAKKLKKIMEPKENDWWICDIHCDFNLKPTKTVRYAVVYQISVLHLFGQWVQPPTPSQNAEMQWFAAKSRKGPQLINACTKPHLQQNLPCDFQDELQEKHLSKTEGLPRPYPHSSKGPGCPPHCNNLQLRTTKPFETAKAFTHISHPSSIRLGMAWRIWSCKYRLLNSHNFATISCADSKCKWLNA